jgi:hypothetical protein
VSKIWQAFGEYLPCTQLFAAFLGGMEPAYWVFMPDTAVAVLEEEEEEVLPRCRCGTTRADKHASPECEYSTMGALYLLWGGTSIPVRVNFRCVFCGEIFDSRTSREEMRQHIS